MKDHIASVELYGIIGVTSIILEKALSGILDVLCWVCLQGRYEIDGGEDGGVDSPSVKKERPDNAFDACFLAGAENGRVVGSGILDLGPLRWGNIQRGGIGTVCQIGSKSGMYFRNITGHAKGDCPFVIVKRCAETNVL